MDLPANAKLRKMQQNTEVAASPLPSRGPTRGQKCYVTPAFSWVPKQRGQNQNWLPDPCLLGGPQEGGKGGLIVGICLPKGEGTHCTNQDQSCNSDCVAGGVHPSMPFRLTQLSIKETFSEVFGIMKGQHVGGRSSGRAMEGLCDGQWEVLARWQGSGIVGGLRDRGGRAVGAAAGGRGSGGGSAGEGL